MVVYGDMSRTDIYACECCVSLCNTFDLTLSENSLRVKCVGVC